MPDNLDQIFAKVKGTPQEPEKQIGSLDDIFDSVKKKDSSAPSLEESGSPFRSVMPEEYLTSPSATQQTQSPLPSNGIPSGVNKVPTGDITQGYQKLSPQEIAKEPVSLRPDGTKKSTGFLGAIKRPDGMVSTEISIGVPINGKETDIPTMIPTLTKEELNYLINTDEGKVRTENPQLFNSIKQKAIAHAKERIAQGKGVFADSFESPLNGGISEPKETPVAGSQVGLGKTNVPPPPLVVDGKTIPTNFEKEKIKYPELDYQKYADQQTDLSKLHKQAFDLSSQNKFDAADIVLNITGSKFPDDPYIHQLKAHNASLQGNNSGALIEMNVAIKKNPNDLNLYADKALMAWNSDRIEESRKAATMFVKNTEGKGYGDEGFAQKKSQMYAILGDEEKAKEWNDTYNALKNDRERGIEAKNLIGLMDGVQSALHLAQRPFEMTADMGVSGVTKIYKGLKALDPYESAQSPEDIPAMEAPAEIAGGAFELGGVAFGVSPVGVAWNSALTIGDKVVPQEYMQWFQQPATSIYKAYSGGEEPNNAWVKNGLVPLDMIPFLFAIKGQHALAKKIAGRETLTKQEAETVVNTINETTPEQAKAVGEVIDGSIEQKEQTAEVQEIQNQNPDVPTYTIGTKPYEKPEIFLNDLTKLKEKGVDNIQQNVVGDPQTAVRAEVILKPADILPDESGLKKVADEVKGEEKKPITQTLYRVEGMPTEMTGNDFKFYGEEDVANEYSAMWKDTKVVEKEVTYKNPLEITLTDEQFSDPKFEKPHLEKALKDGNDAVIFTNEETGAKHYAIRDQAKPEEQPQVEPATVEPGKEQAQATDLETTVAKYGWTAKKNKKGNYELSNRDGKKIVEVEQKGKKYTLWDNSAKILSSGYNDVNKAVDKLLKDYYFAKEEPVKEASAEPSPTPSTPKAKEVPKEMGEGKIFGGDIDRKIGSALFSESLKTNDIDKAKREAHRYAKSKLGISYDKESVDKIIEQTIKDNPDEFGRYTETKEQRLVNEYAEKVQKQTGSPDKEPFIKIGNQIADAVKNKDVKTLRKWMNGVNPNINRLFTKLTDLPAKTQKEADASIRSLNPEAWDAEYNKPENKPLTKEQKLEKLKQANINKALDVKISHKGETMTKRKWVETLTGEGYKPTTHEIINESAVKKAEADARYYRMNGLHNINRKELDAAKEIINNPPTIKKYGLSKESGSYAVSKTEYDYANELISNKPQPEEGKDVTIEGQETRNRKEETVDKKEIAKDQIKKGIDGLMDKWGTKKNLTPEDKTSLIDDLYDIVKGITDLSALELKTLIEEHIKPLIDILKLKKSEVDEVVGGVMKEAITNDDVIATSLKRAIADNEKVKREGTEAVEKMVDSLQSTNVKEIMDDAKISVDSGKVDPKQVAKRIIRENKGTSEDEAALLYDRAKMRNQEIALENKLSNAPENERTAIEDQLKKLREDDMAENDLAAAKIGRESSNIFRIRKRYMDSEYNIFSLTREFKAKKDIKGELTDEQKKYIDEEYKGIRDAVADLEKIKQQEAEIEQLKESQENQQKITDELNKIIEDYKNKKEGIGGKYKTKIEKIDGKINSAKNRLKILTYGRATSMGILDPEIYKAIKDIISGKVEKFYEETKGKIELNKLLDETLAEAQEYMPELTKQDIQDAMSGNFKKPKQTKTDLQKAKENLRKEIKLRKDNPDIDFGENATLKEIQNKVNNQKEKIKAERKLGKKRDKINKEKENEKYATEKKNKEILKRRYRQIQQVQSDIDNKRYDKAEEPKPFRKSDKVIEAERVLDKRKKKWRADRKADVMSKRSISEKVIDTWVDVIRAFNLSFAGTMLKLAGVVAHNLTTKIPRTLVQKAVVQLIPNEIRKYGGYWGDVQLSSLADYYVDHIKMFRMETLKRVYGKDFQDASHELSSVDARFKFLNYPGKTHQLIKEFVRSPELKFSERAQIFQALKNYKEAEEKLKNPDLSATEKQKWQEQKEDFDVSNPNVMQRISDQAMVDANYQILMNNMKIGTKVKNAFGGHSKNAVVRMAQKILWKSQNTIVTVPINYFSRYIYQKYGAFVKSMIGDYKSDMKQHVPGIFELFGKRLFDKDAFENVNLPPEIKREICKNIVNGSYTAMAMGIALLTYKNITYDRDKKQYFIYGVPVTEKILHLPLMDVILSYATTFNDIEKIEGEKKAKDYIVTSLKNDYRQFKNMPFYNQLTYGYLSNVIDATQNLAKGTAVKAWDEGEKGIGKLISTFTAPPGFVREYSKQIDERIKNGEHLDPITIGEMMKKDWPYLSIDVPTKEEREMISRKDRLETLKNMPPEKRIETAKAVDVKSLESDKKEFELMVKMLPTETGYYNSKGDKVTNTPEHLKFAKDKIIAIQKRIDELKKK